MTSFTRRALLGAAFVLPLAGCAPRAETLLPGSSATTRPTPEPPVEALKTLEQRYEARLGVFAFDSASGASIAYRADERFAFCSTFKALAAAAVLREDFARLDTRIVYDASDIVGHSPVTEQHLGSGMTLRELCEAAIRFSDGTAGNLLLRELGGPAELTAFTRTLGDTIFIMERTEPNITTAIPGDVRDTTSPRAFGDDMRKLVLEDALQPEVRTVLRDWLLANTTGATRIRAGVPPDWTVADKTGSGGYGTANDVAVLWPPPPGAPIVLAAMSTRNTPDADFTTPLIAEATTHVLAALTAS